jgi:hypothetical protein
MRDRRVGLHKLYVASSYVDELDDQRSRPQILSWFDVEEGASVAAARCDAVYRSVFGGFKAFFATVT